MHRVGGEHQLAARDVDVDRAPHLLDASGRRVERHEYGGAQRAGGSVKFGELLVATVLVFAGGLREQQVGDLVEQDQRVVDRVELQLPQRRQQRRGSPLRAQATQRLRLARQPIVSQRPQSTGAHINRGVAGPNRADRRQTPKRFGDLAGRSLRGPVRSTSKREACWPAGTSNSSSRCRRRSAVALSDNVQCSRAAARSRAEATARPSTRAPGRSCDLSPDPARSAHTGTYRAKCLYLAALVL